MSVFPQKLEFTGVCHVLDRGLQISVNWLQKRIFLRDDFLFVQQFLHGFVVSLLSVEGKTLQLVLVLAVVEDGLRQNDVGLN